MAEAENLSGAGNTGLSWVNELRHSDSKGFKVFTEVKSQFIVVYRPFWKGKEKTFTWNSWTAWYKGLVFKKGYERRRKIIFHDEKIKVNKMSIFWNKIIRE